MRLQSRGRSPLQVRSHGLLGGAGFDRGLTGQKVQGHRAGRVDVRADVGAAAVRRPLRGHVQGRPGQGAPFVHRQPVQFERMGRAGPVEPGRSVAGQQDGLRPHVPVERPLLVERRQPAQHALQQGQNPPERQFCAPLRQVRQGALGGLGDDEVAIGQPPHVQHAHHVPAARLPRGGRTVQHVGRPAGRRLTGLGGDDGHAHLHAQLAVPCLVHGAARPAGDAPA